MDLENIFDFANLFLLPILSFVCYIPNVLMLIPSSGTLTQYCSSDRRQDTIASIAFVMARSIPFSLTKNVYSLSFAAK